MLTLLECRGLCKAFGRQRVLDGIDLTLYSGEIVSLVGRSGAGKTTLARTLAGLLPLEGGGSVEFQGKRPTLPPSTAAWAGCRWCSRTARPPSTPA